MFKNGYCIAYLIALLIIVAIFNHFNLMSKLQELINLLNESYLKHYDTVLVGGFDEPFYQAATGAKPARIQFSHDYIRSALHELAHWCVAGVERRKLDDYGYWYAEDGRSQEQQDEFYKLEIKPQTIEWAFSIICGVKFEASVDNLNNSVDGTEEFKHNLSKQMQDYLTRGFSKRTNEILHLISRHQKIASPIQYLQSHGF